MFIARLYNEIENTFETSIGTTTLVEHVYGRIVKYYIVNYDRIVILHSRAATVTVWSSARNVGVSSNFLLHTYVSTIQCMHAYNVCMRINANVSLLNLQQI